MRLNRLLMSSLWLRGARGEAGSVRLCAPIARTARKLVSFMSAVVKLKCVGYLYVLIVSGGWSDA